ncbi:MAG: hypothetical protein IJU78_00715 [Clostridia bacterium]|nr:hypothetical protein [Clostridia bacterium]
MAKKEVMQGNEAVAESALRAGCRFFAGYPITPQSEITEYLALKMNDMPGRAFVQGESEVASINMVFGASAAGARAMTATASHGLSLMAETLSFCASQTVPAVIVDVGRAISSTDPAQTNYNFITKSLGHGGFRPFCFAPATVQESADMVYEAFDIADKYRCVVFVMTDGMLGHLIETVELKPYRELADMPERDWAPHGCGRGHVTHGGTPYIRGEALANRQEEIYAEWERDYTRVEDYYAADAEVLVLAWGTVARTAKSAVKKLRGEGCRVGLLRPQTLFPFPNRAIREIDERRVRHILVLEDAIPYQFYHDVMYALGGKPIPVTRYARSMGVQVSAEEAEEQLRRLL